MGVHNLSFYSMIKWNKIPVDLPLFNDMLNMDELNKINKSKSRATSIHLLRVCVYIFRKSCRCDGGGWWWLRCRSQSAFVNPRVSSEYVFFLFVIRVLNVRWCLSWFGWFISVSTMRLEKIVYTALILNHMGLYIDRSRCDSRWLVFFRGREKRDAHRVCNIEVFWSLCLLYLYCTAQVILTKDEIITGKHN